MQLPRATLYNIIITSNSSACLSDCNIETYFDAYSAVLELDEDEAEIDISAYSIK